MLQTIQIATNHLGDRAGLLRNFLLGKFCPDGGMAGRAYRSDLYYTLFGLECLLGLGKLDDPGRIESYLAGFAGGENLDFVHLCCLARCRADLNIPLSPDDAVLLAGRLESYRSGDGGFSVLPGASHGSAYACMLATGAMEDLNVPMRRPGQLIESLNSLKAAGGGYANELAFPTGASAASAAAIVTLRQLGQAGDDDAVGWLQANALPVGGFPAWPGLPADLLSTAVACYALSLADGLTEQITTAGLAYVNSLWDARGAFRPDPSDDTLDCEYAWYGLLALGSLKERL
jgi:prenyltransferase beta subunit